MHPSARRGCRPVFPFLMDQWAPVLHFQRRPMQILGPIYNQNLSVCPLTTHLPIKYVSKQINKFDYELVKKISIPLFNNTTDRMILANHTLKQLNIIDDNMIESKQYGNLSSVLTLLNKCSTPMGKRKFQYQF